MLVIPWGGGGLFNYYYLKSQSLPAPPAKKKVIIIGRPPPSKKKSNNNSTPPGPPHRFRELFLPLKSFLGACSVTNFVYGSFFVYWNSFSAATKCVSGRLFCQWIGLRVSGRRFVFLHSRLCSILIIWNHNRCPPPPAREKKSNNNWPPPPFEEKK